MKEKINELYRNYIIEKLPLIFSKKDIEDENNIKLSSDDKGFFFADEEGNNIFGKWYDKAYDFKNGFARVCRRRSWNFIDINGNLLCEEWFRDAEDFNNTGYALVQRDLKNKYAWNCIDKNGKLRFKNGFNIIHFNNNSFVHIQDKLECINSNNKDYKISKTLNGYRCSKKGDSFSIKYEPIKIYGRYVLCLRVEKERIFFIDKKKTIQHEFICVFDRKNGTYKELDSVYEVEFDDDFVYVLKKQNGEIIGYKKVFLMYRDSMIDITNYYNTNLVNEEEIHINKDVDILNEDDFFYHTEEEIKRLLEEDKKNAFAKEEKRKKEKEKGLIEEQQRKVEQERIDRAIERQKAIEMLKKSITQLDSLERGNTNSKRIQLDNIFINVDDHKEIMPIIIETNILKRIDLSHVSFKNVKIDGIDFRDCNMTLLPQEVYKRNLKDCNFEGINFSPFTNFEGVDIRGCIFGSDSDAMTMDIMPNFKGAIYDETTTYNGISLVNIYNESSNRNKK